MGSGREEEEGYRLLWSLRGSSPSRRARGRAPEPKSPPSPFTESPSRSRRPSTRQISRPHLGGKLAARGGTWGALLWLPKLGKKSSEPLRHGQIQTQLGVNPPSPPEPDGEPKLQGSNGTRRAGIRSVPRVQERTGAARGRYGLCRGLVWGVPHRGAGAGPSRRSACSAALPGTPQKAEPQPPSRPFRSRRRAAR